MMVDPHRPTTEDVDHLLRNAQLREALEPFMDDSIVWLDSARISTPAENEFLASLLAWERAPSRPIAQWFEPELVLPRPSDLADDQLHQLLWETIEKLYSKRVVLDFADHLTDRELYLVIYRDILPAHEKQLDERPAGSYLHWDCANTADNPEIWLTFYASDAERRQWAESNFETPPARRLPPFPRELPRQPL